MAGCVFGEEGYAGEAFESMAGDHADCAGIDFSRCVFRACSFPYARFADCSFQGCSFEGCNLTLTNLEGTRLLDTSFTNCKLTGVNWSNPSGVFRAAFRGCLLDDCSFASLNLSRYVFSECSLRNAVFAETKLVHARFDQCDLAGCVFQNTDLSFADFSTSRDYFIDARTNRLHKTAFSLPEAASLLSNFDIVLK